MTPLLGFAPDVESTTPGVLVECNNFIPYKAGMQAAPSLVTPSGVPALGAECLGAAVLVKLDDTRRVIAGTADALYELQSGSWVDVTRGSAYTGGVDSRWSFAQFGNGTIAANKSDTIQRSISGEFADISGAPKAEVVFSVGSFVMALNVDDGADKPDGWHCCAAFDDTDWVESITTQSASGRLVSTPGKLTAGLRLGEYAVAYKNKSIHLGQYVGQPDIWDWQLVTGGDAGCVGKEALCDVDGAHFFVGTDNFWLFDGTRPIPLGGDIRQWFYDNCAAGYLYKTKCVYERQNRRVWVFYPNSGATECDSVIIYHLDSKQWGKATATIQSALTYVSEGISIDGLDAIAATIDDLNMVSFDSPYWLTGGVALSVFNSSNQLQSYTGVAGSSSFTTGDAGDDSAVTALTRLRLRFAAGYSPSTASATFYNKMDSGDGLTVGQTTTIDGAKFDVRQSARWHRAVISMTGDARVTGIEPELMVEGDR